MIVVNFSTIGMSHLQTGFSLLPIQFFRIMKNIAIIIIFLLQFNFVATIMGLLQVLKDFAAGTSIHGLTFLVQPQLSVVRRLSWALIFLGALIYAGRQLNISVICKFGWFMLIILVQKTQICLSCQLFVWILFLSSKLGIDLTLDQLNERLNIFAF